MRTHSDCLGQMLEHVLRRHEAHSLIGFLGNPGNMRREQHVRNIGKTCAILAVKRLGFEHVQSYAAKPTVAHCFDCRPLVDDATARGVDEYCTRSHVADEVSTDQVTGLIGQR